MNTKKSTRRGFIEKTGLALAGLAAVPSLLGASSYKRIVGANEKIRVGFIGVGNRGSQLLSLFMQHPDCEVAALCDVYEPYITRNRGQVDPRYLETVGGSVPQMGEKFPFKPQLYTDYRKLLEDKSIDAVCIATPDHWHALQTIHAIQAGKDVFVEKPLTKTIVEGRKMVEAQAASKQVVAVGLNRRGAESYQKLAKEIPTGKIGKVMVARAFRIANMAPHGIGKMQPEQPPKDFNWDLWLGPRAFRPYQYNIAPYRFRWWDDYSSQMGNWGVHFLDVIRWMMGETAPSTICATGGKYAIDDDRTIPDTVQVTFEFATGALVSFCIYEASSGKLFPEGEVELRGTKGNLYASEDGYHIIPSGGRGSESAKEEEYKVNTQMLSDGSNGSSTGNLIRNFLDCVKSRQSPLCTLEEGHRSTSFAHLANIALATGEKLKWDAANERFTNSAEANTHLHYEYRRPWKL
ncbi:MAG: Gfo/Idh/MocA family oxidoreductase [Prolixibacteraceae bacterium]|jgi:predicted dehydrogenase|nr:Gfo/Idh/MocA family oxidoreductase [Prolixibacteraceae bacterium]